MEKALILADHKTIEDNGNIHILPNVEQGNAYNIVSHSVSSTCLFGSRRDVKPTDVAHFKNNTS